MKRVLLLTTSLLLVSTIALAGGVVPVKHGKTKGLTKRYRYTKPIKFVERGVEFFVFPNGEFDYNTSGVAYYRGRTNLNVSIGTSGTRVHYRSPKRRHRGVRVEYDYYGRVHRIGNVFINYDRRGRIKRAGTVYIGYNRRGLASNIGGLYIHYDRWGRIVDTSGYVSEECGYEYWDDYRDDYYYKKDPYYYKNKKRKRYKKGHRYDD
ncbi:hypothetical protein GWK08_10275 [Leptobacterium flavescens]|uniref:Uncharacterized protein n=1 Tax=Leptobacterium flavescens TaxID=472055 RepID=A0A6P0ULG9_9FLAO|nr:hypothetical protein [Leptobacterium flavescens]NER13827.1 hypothetical protein [Leptobacterium flavescens]